MASDTDAKTINAYRSVLVTEHAETLESLHARFGDNVKDIMVLMFQICAESESFQKLPMFVQGAITEDAVVGMTDAYMRSEADTVLSKFAERMSPPEMILMLRERDRVGFAEVSVDLFPEVPAWFIKYVNDIVISGGVHDEDMEIVFDILTNLTKISLKYACLSDHLSGIAGLAGAVLALEMAGTKDGKVGKPEEEGS